MRRIIRIGPKAVRDLDEHEAYLARDSLMAAIRFQQSAQSAFQFIAVMPGVGSPQSFHNPALAEIRRWPIQGFENYLIFYRSDDEQVEVIRVLHGARNIAKIMENE